MAKGAIICEEASHLCISGLLQVPRDDKYHRSQIFLCTASLMPFLYWWGKSVVTSACAPAGFLTYVFCALVCTVFLVVYVAPVHGTSNIFVYVAICSIVGSLSVMSVKVRTLNSPCLCQ